MQQAHTYCIHYDRNEIQTGFSSYEQVLLYPNSERDLLRNYTALANLFPISNHF